jgi:predicted NUDIX family NTP pyrophosphohydrolase
MPKRSAGLLMYRRRGSSVEVFLVHPGGPFWAKKDLASWTIPKGECGEDEHPLHAAKREFQEETGFSVEGNFVPLGDARQPSGKIVEAWAVEGDCDPSELKSNRFSMEWPPRSERQVEFPEVDRGAWFKVEAAREKILKGQVPLLDRLLQIVG